MNFRMSRDIFFPKGDTLQFRLFVNNTERKIDREAKVITFPLSAQFSLTNLKGESVKRGRVGEWGLMGCWERQGGVYLHCNLRTGLDWLQILQSTLQCQYCWTVCCAHTPSATWRREV